ncbi:diguanylate phosphodiesterase [Bacillus coahuilensis m2-6]|nr:diguanylate phosphodiesterase [Bacillus coahuilensis m2-6]
MQSCIHCSLTISLPESGYMIMGEYKQNHHNRILTKESQSTIAYQSISQLKDIIKVALDQNIETVTIQKHRNESPHTYSTKQLALYIQHFEELQMIQSEELVSYIQPILTLETNKLFGYESLLRSNNPAISFNPGRLFEVANTLGLNSFLDKKARELAIKARMNQIPKGVKSFINFLPSTIYNPEFCLMHTFQVVEKYQVDPNDLVFEVVETENIKDIDHLKLVLDTYRREGMKVALDDVGSGFSTIEMLTLLQPDIVKVDRHYISHCDKDDNKQQFLKQVIERANLLGITTLAEGIERKEEVEVLKQLGFHLGQGYFFGKPSPTVEYFQMA